MVAPGSPRHEQRSLGGGVELLGLRQEGGAGHPRQPLVGEHDGYLLASRLESVQGAQPCLRRARTHDVVVAAVALAELMLDPVARIGVGIDKERLGSPAWEHTSLDALPAAGAAAASLPPRAIIPHAVVGPSLP
jgi:hypothetical protein